MSKASFIPSNRRELNIFMDFFSPRGKVNEGKHWSWRKRRAGTVGAQPADGAWEGYCWDVQVGSELMLSKCSQIDFFYVQSYWWCRLLAGCTACCLAAVDIWILALPALHRPTGRTVDRRVDQTRFYLFIYFRFSCFISLRCINIEVWNSFHHKRNIPCCILLFLLLHLFLILIMIKDAIVLAVNIIVSSNDT